MQIGKDKGRKKMTKPKISNIYCRRSPWRWCEIIPV